MIPDAQCDVIYHLLPDCHMRLMMAHDASKPVLVHVMQQMPSVSLQTADQQKLLQRQQEVPEGGLRCGHSRTSITPCGPLRPNQVMRCKTMRHTLYAALFTVNVISRKLYLGCLTHVARSDLREYPGQH